MASETHAHLIQGELTTTRGIMTTISRTVADRTTLATTNATVTEIVTSALQTISLELQSDRTYNLNDDKENLVTEFSFSILPELERSEIEPSFLEVSDYNVTSRQTDNATALSFNRTSSLVNLTDRTSHDLGASISLAAWIGVGSALCLILMACFVVLLIVTVQKIKQCRARKRRIDSLNEKVILRLQLSSLMAKDQLQSPQTACVRLTEDDSPSRRASSDRSKRRSGSLKGDRPSCRSNSLTDDKRKPLSSIKAEQERLSMIDSIGGTQGLQAPIVVPEQVDDDLEVPEVSEGHGMASLESNSLTNGFLLRPPNRQDSKELYEKDSDTNSINIDYPAFVINTESFSNIDGDDNDNEGTDDRR